VVVVAEGLLEALVVLEEQLGVAMAHLAHLQLRKWPHSPHGR
jgi:hypothetical protein